MENKKISSIQVGALLIMITIAAFSGIGIFSIVKASGIDAYLSVLIAGIIGTIYLLVYFYIAGYEPDLMLGEKICKLFGNKIGNILNIVVAGLILILGINVMFNLANFIVSQFLPETPNYVVGILFAIVVIYVNIKGIETLARTSFILTILSIILFGVTSFGLSATFEINNLMPFLEHGISRPFQGAFYILSLNLVSIFNLLIIPKNQLIDSKKLKRIMSISYVISIVALFVIVILTLGNLGIYLASIYQYPEYIVLKRIKIFNFIDRIENILTIQFIFSMFVSMCFGVYCVANLLKPRHKSKLLPTLVTILILIVATKAFKNNTIFNNYTYHIMPFIRLVFVAIIFIIALFIFIKRRKSRNQNKQDYYIE